MGANIYLRELVAKALRIKLLIIAAHRPNRSPSQRFRFEQYLDFLSQNGIDTHLSYLIEARDDEAFYSPGKFSRKFWILFRSYLRRWKDVLTCGRYDVVLIQREAIMTRTVLFEKLLAWRKPVVFDFDDAIWKMDVSEANQKLKWMKNPSKTGKIIRLSKVVMAGNTYLQQYAQQFNSNTVIVPTTVDTEIFQRGEKDRSANTVTIGWSGSKTTIKHFEMAVPVLERIRREFGEKVRIKVIGEPNYTNESLGVTSVAWTSQTEVEELRSIDIGIMPLPGDEWSKGKCGLKGLTYMALEIPTVMSAVGVNTEIIEHGVNGLLFDNDEDFYRQLKQLIEDSALRERLGKNGRATVVEKYSVLANREKYVEVIRGAALFQH